MPAQKIIDIFGPGANPDTRVVHELDVLTERVKACRALGLTVVLTSGTFDVTHVGHLRYLERAKEHGDVLVVGVDSDAKVRARKGPSRPIVDEVERMEIVCHSRYADLVFLKPQKSQKWELIRTVHPDVLVVTQDTYTEEEVEELGQYCGKVIVLEAQATTSTTARIRSLLVDHATQVRERMRGAMTEIERCFDELIGDVPQPPTPARTETNNGAAVETKT